MFKNIVVGCGFAGATIAKRLHDKGEQVLIIDKKNHIGGQMYDYRDRNGIMIHKYGPHIFHTNNENVIKFLSKFAEFHTYYHRVLSFHNGNYYEMPINLNTIKKIIPDYDTFVSFLNLYAINDQINIKDAFEKCKNKEVNKVYSYLQKLYNTFIQNYSKKSWGKHLDNLESSVFDRIPIKLNYDNGYFNDKYCFIPKNGYTSLFENMLDGIPKLLGINALKLLSFRDNINDYEFNPGKIYFNNEEFNGRIFFTGNVCDIVNDLDSTGDNKYFLDYRSLRFDLEEHNTESYQDVAVVNYPNIYDFTRITEFKKFLNDKSNNTVICKEYQEEGNGTNEMYYPIPSIEQKSKYNHIEKIIKRKFKDKIVLLGRQAEYKYYNMDVTISNALDLGI